MYFYKILFNYTKIYRKIVSLYDISKHKYLDLLLQDQRQPELVLSDLVKCRDVFLQVEEVDNKLEFQEFPWIVIKDQMNRITHKNAAFRFENLDSEISVRYTTPLYPTLHPVTPLQNKQN